MQGPEKKVTKFNLSDKFHKSKYENDTCSHQVQRPSPKYDGGKNSLTFNVGVEILP